MIFTPILTFPYQGGRDLWTDRLRHFRRKLQCLRDLQSWERALLAV